MIAVGRDPLNPIVTDDDAWWATRLVVDQTEALIGKFERGEVGEDAGNEVKQQAEVVRCIIEYIERPFDRVQKYGATAPLHKRHIFTQSYLSRRLLNLPAFKLDRIGATAALKRAIQSLLDAGDIQEIPKLQAVREFDTTARCFIPVATDFLIQHIGKSGRGGV